MTTRAQDLYSEIIRAFLVDLLQEKPVLLRSSATLRIWSWGRLEVHMSVDYNRGVHLAFWDDEEHIDITTVLAPDPISELVKEIAVVAFSDMKRLETLLNIVLIRQ